jgi:hypothetical protein
MAVNRWAALAICAATAAAIAIVVIAAFEVRGSGEAVTVTVPESGDAAEYEWASRVCAAIAEWDRAWVETVVEPTKPANAKRGIPIAEIIGDMRTLTAQLRTDLEAIAPPTERAREAQGYIVTTPKGYAREFAELKPDFSVEDYAPFLRSRSAALNFRARGMRVETTWLIKYPGYARPHVGLALVESPVCDEVPRLPRLKEWG